MWRISKTNEQLVITELRRWHLIGLAFLLVCFGGWYYQFLFLPYTHLSKQLYNWPMLPLFLLAPLLLLPAILREARIAGAGQVFTFDRSTDRLLRNRTLLCAMSMIDFVELRTISVVYADSNDYTGYEISVICRDDKKHKIADGVDEGELLHLAGEIADYAGLKVVQK